MKKTFVVLAALSLATVALFALPSVAAIGRCNGNIDVACNYRVDCPPNDPTCTGYEPCLLWQGDGCSVGG